MTAPAVGTGIVAFIEARLKWREDRARNLMYGARGGAWIATLGQVRLLAAIDADHSSFDPSWKPVAG